MHERDAAAAVEVVLAPLSRGDLTCKFGETIFLFGV